MRQVVPELLPLRRHLQPPQQRGAKLASAGGVVGVRASLAGAQPELVALLLLLPVVPASLLRTVAHRRGLRVYVHHSRADAAVPRFVRKLCGIAAVSSTRGAAPATVAVVVALSAVAAYKALLPLNGKRLTASGR